MKIKRGNRRALGLLPFIFGGAWNKLNFIGSDREKVASSYYYFFYFTSIPSMELQDSFPNKQKG